MKRILFLVTFFSLTLVANFSIAQNKVVVVPLGSNPFQGDLYQNIPGIAFLPESPGLSWVRGSGISSTDGYLQIDDSFKIFAAPVLLPDGAKVSQLSAYVENSGDRGCYLEFEKMDMSTRTLYAITTFGEVSSDALSFGQYAPVHVAITGEIFDNQNYQYLLSWFCNASGTIGDKLYSVRITYRLQ